MKARELLDYLVSLDLEGQLEDQDVVELTAGYSITEIDSDSQYIYLTVDGI